MASESSHFSTQQGLKTITATRRRSSIFSKSPRMVGQTEIPCCTRTGLGPWFKHGAAMESQQVSDPFRNSFIWCLKNGVYPCIPPLHGQFDLWKRFVLNGGGRFPRKLDESGLSGESIWVRGSATADSNAEPRHRGCAGNSPSKA